VNDNKIYVGGQFTTAGGNAAFSIAMWDGTTWHPLGKGINQANNFVAIATVYSLLGSPDGLYAGGQFTHAGDKYSNMIAHYSDFTTGVELINTQNPEDFSLSQNYPNPFNPSTKIQFALPKESFTKLEIFNAIGEKVSTLVSENLSAGIYEYEWNAKELSSGIYFYRLITDKFSGIKKMILLR